MKAVILFGLLICPFFAWSQNFMFFNEELEQVKEKKAKYFSDRLLSGEGNEFLVLKPFPNSGLDTILVSFENGEFVNVLPFEWVEASFYERDQLQEKGKPEKREAAMEADDKETVTIFVRFTVNGAGRVEDLQVIKNDYPALSREAVKKIMQHSKEQGWTPAYHRGRPVPLTFIMPITFNLNNYEENKGE